MTIDFLIAFITGIFASMGVGGGMILIIYLTSFSGIEQISAQGINLIYFIPIAAFSVILHSRNKLIQWKKIIPSLLTGIIFAAAGAYAAEFLGSDILKKIYGVFILAVGLKELWTGNQNHPLNGWFAKAL